MATFEMQEKNESNYLLFAAVVMEVNIISNFETKYVIS